MQAPADMQWPILGGLSFTIGWLMTPLVFANAWITKDFHAVSTLLDILGEVLFPLNFFLIFGVGMLATFLACEIAGRTRTGVFGYFATAATAPIILLILLWIPLSFEGARPSAFLYPAWDEPLSYYAFAVTEMALISISGVLFSTFYLIRVRMLVR